MGRETRAAPCTAAAAARSPPARPAVAAAPASRGRPNANLRSRSLSAARGQRPAPTRPAWPAAGGAAARVKAVSGGYLAGIGRFKSGAISGSASASLNPASSSRVSSCASCSSADASPRHARSSRSISVTAWKGVFWIKCPGRRLDPGVRGARDLFTEALHQTRLADSRLADDQRHLAFTFDGTLPSTHQQAQFVFAPDKRSQSTRCRGRFEPPAYSAGLDYTVKLDRPFNPLERLRSAILDHEQPGDQPMRIRAYQYRARSGGRLHARGNIGRVAEYVGVFARTCAHHHRA